MGGNFTSTRSGGSTRGSDSSSLSFRQNTFIPQHAYVCCDPCTTPARLWVPCMDKFDCKCTWRIEITVPQYCDQSVVNGSPIGLNGCVNPSSDMAPLERENCVVICSGNAISCDLIHPKSEGAEPRRRWVFEVSIPICPSYISFAVGSC
jgi:hypothetical protein